MDNVIVPMIRNEVVKHVLNQEEINAFPSEDFEVHHVKGMMLTPCSKNKESMQMIKIKYRQKMKKTKECFHEAFIRHLEGKGKVFSTDEIKFSFSDCKFRRISP